MIENLQYKNDDWWKIMIYTADKMISTWNLKALKVLNPSTEKYLECLYTPKYFVV